VQGTRREGARKSSLAQSEQWDGIVQLPNSAAEKGLPANGIPAKGRPAKDLPANGVATNGVAANGIPASGVPAKSVPVKRWGPRVREVKYLDQISLQARDLISQVTLFLFFYSFL